MSKPTKEEDLQRRLAAAGADIAALRELVAVMRDIAVSVPFTGDDHADLSELKERVDYMRGYTRTYAETDETPSAAHIADLRRLAEGGIGAVAARFTPPPAQEPAAAVRVAAQPEVCGACPPDSSPGDCIGKPRHPLPHRNAAGFEWGDPPYPDVSGGGVPVPDERLCAAPGHVEGSWCIRPYDVPHMHEDEQGRKWGTSPVEPAQGDGPFITVADAIETLRGRQA